MTNQKNPVLLFSGGVDFGIIASRLVLLGFTNTLLIKYSFVEDDKESILAEKIAKLLGLRFERVFAKKRLCACLDNPGILYTQTF